jgi:flagellar basal body-associated protein FliL
LNVNDGKRSVWVWILVIVLVAAAAVATTYFVMSQQPATEKPIEPVVLGQVVVGCDYFVVSMGLLS